MHTCILVGMSSKRCVQSWVPALSAAPAVGMRWRLEFKLALVPHNQTEGSSRMTAFY